MTDLAARFDAGLSAIFDRSATRLGLAVSGGSDSTALLILAADWARANGVTVEVASVDHGLRAEAAAEAAGVAAICAQLGVGVRILRWDETPKGNLPAAARSARYSLIGDWARARGIGHVALGHTQDDQAETFVMRLMRGSGVDGLAAMSPVRQANGIAWLRPLLCIGRAELRAMLRRRGIGWVDDPGNEDVAQERVRVRQALGTLTEVGLVPRRLADTAHQMARARHALERATRDAAADMAQATPTGDVLLARKGLVCLPDEIALRLLAHALCWVASADYRPRLAALEAALEAALSGRGSALHGCRVIPARGGAVRVLRELAELPGPTPAGELWDRRWQARGPATMGATIAAMGEEGIKQLAGWRESGVPRISLLAAPAIWQGARLISAPLAGKPAGWRLSLTPPRGDLLNAVLTH